MRFATFFWFYLLGTCLVLGQEEETIEEVVVQAEREFDKSLKLELRSDAIQNKLANDLGNILMLFPGLQVKNYGDVGGMKTVSFRSLGPGHSSVVQDYMNLSHTQSGQADLSNLPVDFVQQVQLITLSPTLVDVPVHSKLAGAVVNCQTIHASPATFPKKFILGIQAGSFDQYEAYTMGNWVKKKFALSVSGKIRSYQGNFPFTYQNAQQNIRERRLNNGLLEYFGTLSFQWNPSEAHTIQVRFSGNEYKKELAGAVIFYNNHANQYLNGNGFVSQLNHRYKKRRWHVFSQVNYQKNYLQYLDSSYLNIVGYLDSRYHADQLDLQSQATYHFKPNLELLFGTSWIYEQLNGNHLTYSPVRNTSESLLGLRWRWVGTILGQVGFQGVDERTSNYKQSSWSILPAFLWQFNLGKHHQIGFSYRYTLRQPSFSEKYYQQIGIKELRPEKAHIAAIHYEYVYPLKNGQLKTFVQPFYTYTFDRIIAIPTKNLFIWSILNIGKSDAIGLELIEQFEKKVKNSTWGARINYTFQYTRDLTDPNNETYGHILSYSPLHTGSTEVNYSYKRFGIFVLGTYLGERYALNQNIAANLLEGYFLLNAGANYTQKLKTGELTLRLTVNNLLNTSYAYINYFVMPGTNFQIRLQYGF